MRLPGREVEVDKVTQAVGQRQYFGGDTAARAPYDLEPSSYLTPRPGGRP